MSEDIKKVEKAEQTQAPKASKNKPGKGKKRHRLLTMERRRQLEGIMFVSPFIIGLAVFFLFPVITSLRLAFSDVISIKGFDLSFAGLKYFFEAITEDTELPGILSTVLSNAAMQVPLILVFSLLLAILLSRKIAFNGAFRVIFLLPFLLGSGYVMQQLMSTGVNMRVLSLHNGFIIPPEIIFYLGTDFTNIVLTFLGTIVSVLWSSGVQILLFLSGIQAINPSLYEAAKVDGATEWESFWKVTIPMVSPIALVNIVYTLINSFNDITNPMLDKIKSVAFSQYLELSLSSAIAWMYMAIILFLVGIVFLVVGTYVARVQSSRGKVRKF